MYQLVKQSLLRRILVSRQFRMPLHAEQPVVFAHFKRFHNTIRGVGNNS
jgi:hypothetical protein